MTVIAHDELVQRIACALSFYCDGDVGEAENWRGAAMAVVDVLPPTQGAVSPAMRREGARALNLWADESLREEIDAERMAELVWQAMARRDAV